jgi:hypothetical protein
MRKLAYCLMAATAALTAASSANAAVVFLDSVTQEGDLYRFNYVVQFAGDEGVTDGSTVAIYDFQGYVADSITSTNGGVTATTELTTSGLPMAPGYTDDAGVVNLRFTYNGDTLDLSNQTFGGFSALSRFGDISLDGFSGLSIKTAGAINTDVFTQGSVGVPAVAAVPEPASWAMMIGGFGLLGAAARQRRVKAKLAYA